MILGLPSLLQEEMSCRSTDQLSQGLARLIHKLILFQQEDSCNTQNQKIFSEMLQIDAVPSVSRIKYFLDVAAQQNIADLEISVAAVIFVLRLSETKQLRLGRSNWRGLLLVAQLIARKVLLDEPTELSLFQGIISGFGISEIAAAEIKFCQLLDFNLFLPQQTYYAYTKQLVEQPRKVKRPLSLKVMQHELEIQILDEA